LPEMYRTDTIRLRQRETGDPSSTAHVWEIG
jgi:hypothetical protein